MLKQLLALGLAGLVLAGCAANPATGGRSFNMISPAQEREIGNATAQEYIKRFGLYRPASTVTGYVMDLCRQAWDVTELAAEPVQCLFLDAEAFNAWATPGYISVNRGLLPYMQTEAQLVGVLGHEAGHITGKHIGQRVTAGIVGSVLTTAVGVYVAGQTDDRATTNIATGLAGAGVGMGVASYGRAHELQADSLGQRYMERLGYDKRESVAMVGAMLAKEAYDKQFLAAFNDGQAPTEDVIGQLYASHPASPARQAEAAKSAGGWPDGGLTLPAGIKPATTANDPQGRARFHRAIDGLTYGPARAFGIAGRNVLYLPAQRFVLQLPSGFLLDFAGADTKKKTILWQAAHPASLVEAKIAILPFKAGMNVGYVLKDMLSFNGDLQRLALKAAHKPPLAEAYTGTGNAFGAKPHRLVAIALPDTDALAVVAFNFTDNAQRVREQDALIAAIQDSRFLSIAEAKALKPLEIRTFRASSVDTVSLAARTLPQGALQAEWFRAMNALAPDEDLRPGVWYKTVVDRNV
jgi:predicted Zn-dependent protease